jgi:NTP pyrophosphatase (non-canonical NTP hydrolase)
MTNHFNKLTEAEAERLALLMEEMGECQQVIGKILRHGYESKHPKGGVTNRKLLEAEIGDVAFAIELMITSGDLSNTAIDEHTDAKGQRVIKYLHHQEERR